MLSDSRIKTVPADIPDLISDEVNKNDAETIGKTKDYSISIAKDATTASQTLSNNKGDENSNTIEKSYTASSSTRTASSSNEPSSSSTSNPNNKSTSDAVTSTVIVPIGAATEPVGTPTGELASPKALNKSVSQSSALSAISTTSKASSCRICFECASPAEPLVAPCKCHGNMQYVHQACLQTWINVPKRNRNSDFEGGVSCCESNWHEALLPELTIPDRDSRSHELRTDEQILIDHLGEARIIRNLNIAYFRVVTRQDTERDRLMISTMGDRFEGAWQDLITILSSIIVMMHTLF